MNSAGLTILFNTIGAAFGPLLAGFVLLPELGFQMSLILSAAAYATLALLTSQKSNWSLRRVSGIAMLLLGAAFIVTLSIFPYHRDEIHFANGRRPYQVDGSFLIRKSKALRIQFNRCAAIFTASHITIGWLPTKLMSERCRVTSATCDYSFIAPGPSTRSQNALLVGYGVGDGR